MNPRKWLGALALGLIGGVALAAQGGAVAREDLMAPVLALGLTIPLGWGGASLAQAVRVRVWTRREE